MTLLPYRARTSVPLLYKRDLDINQDTAFETPGSGVVQLWIKHNLGQF